MFTQLLSILILKIEYLCADNILLSYGPPLESSEHHRGLDVHHVRRILAHPDLLLLRVGM